MGQEVNKNNQKILRDTNPTPIAKKGCNCQAAKLPNCPLPGNCTADNVVYRATVSVPSEPTIKDQTYAGLTADPIKIRNGNHQQDFKNAKRQNATCLSIYIWKLKEQGLKVKEHIKVKYEIICHASPYSPITNKCNLCTAEKFEILTNPSFCTLNSRQELYASCRHKKSKLLIKPEKKEKDSGG